MVLILGAYCISVSRLGSVLKSMRKTLYYHHAKQLYSMRKCTFYFSTRLTRLVLCFRQRLIVVTVIIRVIRRPYTSPFRLRAVVKIEIVDIKTSLFIDSRALIVVILRRLLTVNGINRRLIAGFQCWIAYKSIADVSALLFFTLYFVPALR